MSKETKPINNIEVPSDITGTVTVDDIASFPVVYEFVRGKLVDIKQ